MSTDPLIEPVEIAGVSTSSTADVHATEAPTTAPRTPSGAPDALRDNTIGGVGESPTRPDATLKVTGEFAYGSDLWMDDMLWGVTLRSPHPHARIRRVDLTEALKTAGVFAVLTHDDVPGSKYFGL